MRTIAAFALDAVNIIWAVLAAILIDAAGRSLFLEWKTDSWERKEFVGKRDRFVL